MTEAQLSRFRKALETKQAELTDTLRRRDGIAIEKSADTVDEMTSAVERDLAIRNINLESNLLRNVRAALQRMDDHSFGICVQCDKEIGPARLSAVPWTPFCIECQERTDRQECGAFDPLSMIGSGSQQQNGT
ncbi:MAG: TraR/DksA family transcriptional regulator [Bryobacterales bacterium]|nr:TraR/DksA family transcriptional regulator [Bryobacterales bacterium]